MVTLEFVDNLDKIFIFEKGHLKEHGHPMELFSNQKSIFYEELKTIAPNVMKRLEKGEME